MPAPTTFAEAQDVLALSLPGYTRRAHQMALAEIVEGIYAEAAARKGGDPNQHGILQAGTGTGKSLALLIPGIIASHLEGKRTVVATSTKMLQTQYASKDLPFLTEHLGVPFTYAILKGRANYPCQAKAAEMSHPSPVEAVVKDQMAAAAEDPEAILDREDFPGLTDEEFAPFSMSAAECPGAKDCPFAKTCFAERAKDKAATADIVITNTALLLLDLKLRQETEGKVSLLGDFDMLTVDEAHELPDAATRTLEDTIGASAFRKLSRDMAGYLDRQEGSVAAAEKIEQSANALWGSAELMYRDFMTRTGGKTDPMPLTVNTLITDLGPSFAGLYQAIDEARDEIKATRPIDPDDDRAKTQRARLLRRSADWMSRIIAYTTDSPSKTVRWMEQSTSVFRGEKRTRLFLRSAPIDVAPFLRDAMFSRFPVIMSSATLATGTKKGTQEPDFSYIMRTVGLTPEVTTTFDAGSPFDFPTQAMLYVPPASFPEPSKQQMGAWRAAAQMAMHKLVTDSRGGALLLFTSTTALREAYDGLAHQFGAAGLTVLRQGEKPNGELVRAFKEDGNAVLFGLKSFMVGVDIPGSALRLVILDKLPFAVPTDLLFQARCDALVRQFGKWADFNKLTIPSMILTLVQAYGRLIRHMDDRGVVAILDNRLRTKGYGKTIMNALPPATQTSDIAAASAFLESVR